MPKTQCCVPLCNERGGHRFPKDRAIRRAWTVAIRREIRPGKAWHPSGHSVVCHSHFCEEDYYQETTCGYTPSVRRLKSSAVPSKFPWRKVNPDQHERTSRLQQRNIRAQLQATKPGIDQTEPSKAEVVPEIAEECEVTTTEAPSSPATTPGAPVIRTTCDAATDPVPLRSFSIDKFRHDPAGIHHFTGLEHYQKFMFVFATLGQAAYQLSYMYGPVRSNICVIDRFFMVLLKLRKHYTNFELSRLFDIKESEVYNIFCTWVRFMSLQWRELNLWGNRDLVRFYAPSGFKEQYPKTRVIIDGTECPIKKPNLPTAQQSTYSTYKNKNTVKVLVGISPGGLCTYVSPAYGGSTSDRQIVERSSLTTMCDPGDAIMADKGFDVQDIFACHDISINIPTFFSKKNRMNQTTVLHDRKIASKRIHVERFIGLAKTYKILQQPLNSSETLLSSDIIFICFMLCNFRSNIVSSDA